MSEQQPKQQRQSEGQPERREQEPRYQPRIYVASLSDYNAGRLHGRWLDAAQEPEAILAGISAMLAASPEPGAEEWAIHDYEQFCGLRLGKYESVHSVSKIALGITEHGAAFGAWAEHLGRDSWEDLDKFEDCYQGQWQSLTNYAEHLLDDMGLTKIIEQAVPENLQPYVRVDAEAFGRDLSCNGELSVVADGDNGGVFLFWP